MKSICLIDDDDIFKFIFKKALEMLRFPYQVLEFNNGKEAFEYFNQSDQTQIPDIIFLDLKMSEMDGWDFLTEFQSIKVKFNKEIDIYLISNSSLQRDLKRAKETSGICDYMIKPVPVERLKTILEQTFSISF
jgi:CheY-like chemotaxis protein